MDRKKLAGVTPSSSSNSTIKGLQLFIADLRTAPHLQDQERRIQAEITKIKQNFNAHGQRGPKNQDKVGGYQRKKYIAKLAYIYITSNTTKLNDILFGLDQVVQLLKSKVYSEKYMAYMTLELLYEHKSVVEKINEEVLYQTLLDLRQDDENFVALALNFVGVAGSLTGEFARNEDIISEVFQILRSPTSTIYLKKKSVLAFLTLLKKNPTILTDEAQRKQIWIQRILSLLDDRENYRLTLAALPLIHYIAIHIDAGACTRLVPQLTQILYNCVVVGSSPNSNQFPLEFKFANLPNPWIITQVVSLLNVLIVSSTEDSLNQTGLLLHTSTMNPEILNKLRMCISEAIQLGTRPANDPMERIVQNTVLFSLINFAPKLDPSDEAVTDSVTALCKLLTSGQINIRYLALDSLIKLCAILGNSAMNAIRSQNLEMIFQLLGNERDSSILRKIVDLLYIFTDSLNIKTIADQLLNYIISSKHIADPHIKSDIAVKIAILVEKFATDPNWFVTTSLKLLSLPSLTTVNDDEIWQRLCQIVVNNHMLQRVTCEQLLEYFKAPQTSEPLVKTGAFLLGEYADQITDIIPPGDLFNLFTDKYFTVSNVAKAMILTTVMKLYKISDLVYTGAVKLFQMELSSLDIELQTRSYEYLNIIRISKLNGNPNMVDILFQPIPPFNSTTNPLLRRLGSLQKSNGLGVADDSRNTSVPNTGDMSDPFTNATSVTNEGSPDKNTNKQETYYNNQLLVTNWREGFSRMFAYKRGIFYSSSLIKILFRIDYPNIDEPHLIKVSLTYINESDWEISGFTSTLIPYHTQDNPEYFIQNITIPSGLNMLPKKRIDQSFEVVVRKEFSSEHSPIVSIHFNCGGSSSTVNLKLGIGMSTTLKASNAIEQKLTLVQFVSRWKAMGNALGKSGEYVFERVKPKMSKDSLTVEENLQHIVQTIKRIGFDIVEQTNVPNTIFFGGIIHTKTDGSFGCLGKIRSDEDNFISITCKTTVAGDLVSYIATNIKYALSS
ncbi:hypothetical protein RNJ44_03077 [Nakaseomyces bracarensis]|uniref:AP-2 complex subunit alpha n=1 Tax=Nakaseomyces bracarensis TaxID=273131 RepID=A0ABR4NZA0_9SACH